MNSYRIYSRKTMGLDNRVWFIMLGTVVLLQGFFIYEIVNPVKCIPSFSFGTQTLSPRTDTLFDKEKVIYFTASENNENITWDFGDKTDNTQGRQVTHRFSTDGSFIVKATLNSKCYWAKTITIAKDSVKVIVPIAIHGPDSAQTENEITFSCPHSANSYEWAVKDHPEIANYGKDSIAKYKFPLFGSYTITVTLNRDITKTGWKTVIVTLKPVKTNNTITTITLQCALPIPYPDFAIQLVKVMKKESDSRNFGLYLCKGDSTPVTVNPGKRKQNFTFGDFCQKLSNIKDKDKINMKITVMLIDRGDDIIRGKPVSKAVQHITVHLETSSTNLFNKTVWDDYNKLK